MKKIYYLYYLFIIALTIYFFFKIMGGNTTGNFAIFFIPENENLNYSKSCKDLSVPCIRALSNSSLSQEWIPNCEEYYCGYLIPLPPVKIKINSDGFMDREFSIEKPEDTIRIIALGDSFTFGLGVDADYTWPKLLERKLNQENTKRRFEVLNFGVAGYNTFEEVEMLKKKGLKYKPDIIILAFVSNDILDNSEVRKNYNQLKEDYLGKKIIIPQNLSVNAYLNNLAHDKTVRELEAKPFNEVWEIVDKPILELKNISKHEGFSILLLLFNYFPRQKNALYNYDIPIVDIQEEINQKKFDRLFIIDPLDPHPSEFGHNLTAELVFKKIIEENLY